eukprot:gene11557-13490_t
MSTKLLLAMLAMTVMLASATQTDVMRTYLDGLVNDVAGSIQVHYDIHDTYGNPMHCTKVIQIAAGSYVAVYHYPYSTNFIVGIATSSDLVNWQQTSVLEFGSSQPTVFALTNGDYLMAWEQTYGNGNHIRVRYFLNLADLLADHSDHWVDIAPPRSGDFKVKSGKSIGTPNIYTANVQYGNPFGNSVIVMGLHYGGAQDRQATLTLTNLSSKYWWTGGNTYNIDLQNSVLHWLLQESSNPGNIGSRDELSYYGLRYTLIEGNPSGTTNEHIDFAHWQVFLYDAQTHNADVLNPQPSCGATAFANPHWTILNMPNGQLGLLVSLFIPSEGADVLHFEDEFGSSQNNSQPNKPSKNSTTRSGASQISNRSGHTTTATAHPQVPPAGGIKIMHMSCLVRTDASDRQYLRVALSSEHANCAIYVISMPLYCDDQDKVVEPRLDHVIAGNLHFFAELTEQDQIVTVRQDEGCQDGRTVRMAEKGLVELCLMELDGSIVNTLQRPGTQPVIVAVRHSHFIALSRGRLVEVLDTRTLEISWRVECAGSGLIKDILFTEDMRIIVPSTSSKLLVYNGTQLEATLQGSHGVVYALRWSVVGERVWIFDEAGLHTLAIAPNGEAPLQLTFHEITCCGVDFDARGNSVACGDFLGNLRVWRVDDEAANMGERPQAEYSFGMPIRAVAWGARENMVMVGLMDGSLMQYNVKSGDATLVEALVDGVTAIQWSRGSQKNLLAAGTTGGRLYVYRCQDEETTEFTPVFNVLAHAPHGGPQNDSFGSIGKFAEIWSLVFHPDGQMLATCSEDQTTAIWSVKDGSKIRELRGHTLAVTCVDWQHTKLGCLLVSCADDQTVRVWNTDTWTEIAVFQTTQDVGEWHTVTYIALEDSLEHTRVICATQNGWLFIFDIESQSLHLDGPNQKEIDLLLDIDTTFSHLNSLSIFALDNNDALGYCETIDTVGLGVFKSLSPINIKALSLKGCDYTKIMLDQSVTSFINLTSLVLGSCEPGTIMIPDPALFFGSLNSNQGLVRLDLYLRNTTDDNDYKPSFFEYLETNTSLVSLALGFIKKIEYLNIIATKHNIKHLVISHMEPTVIFTHVETLQLSSRLDRYVHKHMSSIKQYFTNPHNPPLALRTLKLKFFQLNTYTADTILDRLPPMCTAINLRHLVIDYSEMTNILEFILYDGGGVESVLSSLGPPPSSTKLLVVIFHINVEIRGAQVLETISGCSIEDHYEFLECRGNYADVNQVSVKRIGLKVAKLVRETGKFNEDTQATRYEDNMKIFWSLVKRMYIAKFFRESNIELYNVLKNIPYIDEKALKKILEL